MNVKSAVLKTLVLGISLYGAASMAQENLNAASVQSVDEYTLKGSKNFYNGIEPGNSDGTINVVVEIPTGTTGKWEVDPKTGNLIWELKKGKPRVVDYQGGYPANYGTVPKTAMPKEYGGDGESVDVIVLGKAILRGEVVKAKLVGVLNLKDDGDFDGKLLAVRVGSPEAEAATVDELNKRFDGMVTKLGSWFENYKGPDGKIKLESIGGVESAMEILTVSIEAFPGK